MNILDKIIGELSPELGLKRAAARAAFNSVRKFDAASKGRRTSGWYSTNGSANTENRDALHILRDRSREMVRNNSYAGKALNTIGTSVVGDGIRLTPKIIGDGNLEKLREIWLDWAESAICDYDNQHDFYGLQKLVMRSVAEGGDCIARVRRVTAKTGKTGIQLQLLEGDYIDESRDRPLLENGGYIMQGVEFDKDGRRVAYWLFDRHPGDVNINKNFVSQRVDAKSIIHIYFKERLGQVRGIPFGTSSMLKLHDFDDFEDAELMKQKVAACFAAFVHDSNEPGTSATSTGTVSDKIEPGIIENLPAGKSITFANPPTVNGFGGYAKSVLQGAAAGYGVTYEQFTNDLSGVNFSSGRMGWIEFNKMVVDWQNNMLIPMFCTKVFEAFMAAIDIAGLWKGIAKPMWTTPRKQMIDPSKEVKALVEEVRGGLKSWQEAIRELGYEPSEIIKQLITDAKAFKDAGLMPYCDPRFDSNRPPEELGVKGDTQEK